MDRHTEALEDFGKYLKAQREIAQLSIRHLARVSRVSDSYLSQIERGKYQPSPEVLQSIATALNIAPDQLFQRMGWLSAGAPARDDVPTAIAADEYLTSTQKTALVQTYKAMIADK
jgi:transcriptional regulator with XRE-family HTH domain